ncbi:MAG: hypothetical protein WBA91_05260 [Paracoccaceae bacterium]
MITRLSRTANFLPAEDGAVTVDWVVLTAAVVALGGSAIAGLKGQQDSIGNAISRTLDSMTVTTAAL